MVAKQRLTAMCLMDGDSKSGWCLGARAVKVNERFPIDISGGSSSGEGFVGSL
jgi:hypothetical protein